MHHILFHFIIIVYNILTNRLMVYFDLVGMCPEGYLYIATGGAEANTAFFFGTMVLLGVITASWTIACFQFSPSTSIASWAADRRSAPS